jgi:2-phospho-L-lactate guanylyltransferase
VTVADRTGWTVVLPVKNAGRAKSRLAGLRDAGPALARAIALDTIEAVAACTAVARVVVVTDDGELAASAPPGVLIFEDQQGRGPNAAIVTAMASIPDSAPRAALLADLAALRPADLEVALDAAAAVDRGVVPDAEGDGSTLVTARAGVPWESAFGASSFDRHIALGCAVLDVPAHSTLRRDVDTPAHLAAAAALGLGPRMERWRLAGGGGADTVHHDIRLIAVDMDGTLLDGEGRIPDDLWPLLDELDKRGILFAPASGRQLATLKRSFDHARDDVVYIAENGAYVVRGEDEIGSDAIDPGFVASVIRRVRALRDDGFDAGLVVCGKRSAYIERSDAAFREECDKYYAKLEVTDDLLDVDDQVLKLAIFDFAVAETSAAPRLADLRATHQVVVSGEHWIDVMNPGVNKGVALTRLQAALGIERAQTAAFGDYLNDLELLDAAGYSFAMANAHPDVLARARHRAPSNVDRGVITTIRRLLAGEPLGEPTATGSATGQPAAR